MLPQKILKSRRSGMPFVAFFWWHFPPNIIKIQTNFNSISACLLSVLLFKISTVSFRSEILEALKCYFSIRDETKCESRSSAPVQVYWCWSVLSTEGLAFIWRKLKQFFYDHWCPIFAIFATGLERCRERMEGQDLSGGLRPLLILTTSWIGNEAGGCSIRWPTGETGGSRDQYVSEALRTVAPNRKVFFLFVAMWDLLLVPRAVKIQKENGGSPCIFQR